MNPWEMKHKIDSCFAVADRLGFELRDDPGYHDGFNRIHLFAKADNEVFAKEMALNSFKEWGDVMFFLEGYEKAEMACMFAKGKKK